MTTVSALAELNRLRCFYRACRPLVKSIAETAEAGDAGTNQFLALVKQINSAMQDHENDMRETEALQKTGKPSFGYAIRTMVAFFFFQFGTALVWSGMTERQRLAFASWMESLDRDKRWEA